MDIKKFYVSVNGNYEEALALMMNDAFIERMLKKFFNDNSYEEIISCYKNKDFSTLFAKIHSFKGVVGNLSLTPLFDIASTITESTRSLKEVNIDDEINTLIERYSFTKESFQKMNN